MACENCETDEPLPDYPDVEIYDEYVTVQFHEKGPVFVLDEDGNIAQRWCEPSFNVAAQLTLGGAA